MRKLRIFISNTHHKNTQYEQSPMIAMMPNIKFIFLQNLPLPAISVTG